MLLYADYYSINAYLRQSNRNFCMEEIETRETAIGNGHAAVKMKNDINVYLIALGHEGINMGTDFPECCDYLIYGEKEARAVAGRACPAGKKAERHSLSFPPRSLIKKAQKVFSGKLPVPFVVILHHS